ncbi:hypothetical protein JOD31_001066 [Methylopila capsulata]|uniref:Uncharacterized protein n=1 Tax=Methylopila capsulata TaxID=61654 RepID=A0A9W6IW14_9HYPH|nr:hypothetical protein [Methylopila capsulata]MBM7850854.1 hypothetical protein [Methylopila capsulata]GLK56151.1 hypothetical protein GCM10008170_21700 [Methylopila capsulata]
MGPVSIAGKRLHCLVAEMIVYEPLPLPVRIQASLSGLADFHWSFGGITADFWIPDDEAHVLRVIFNTPCIVRIVDEFALSTERPEGSFEGLVPENFAYVMRGDPFEAAQSETWKFVIKANSHYRFVTGWACLDVLAASAPSFEIIANRHTSPPPQEATPGSYIA